MLTDFLVVSFRGELIVFGSHDNLNTEDVFKILCMIDLSLPMVLLLSIEIIVSQSSRYDTS